MPATGYIQIYAYTSKARIPLRNVAVMISDTKNSAIAMGLTDKNGKYGPISIAVPDLDESLSPGFSKPYTTVNLHARLEDYEQIEAENVQVFADTVTIQNFEMIPLSELPEKWSETEIFDTPGQNL